MFEHERLERLERVLEAFQPSEVARSEDEVLRAGEPDRRRKPRVELVRSPPEQRAACPPQSAGSGSRTQVDTVVRVARMRPSSSRAVAIADRTAVRGQHDPRWLAVGARAARRVRARPVRRRWRSSRGRRTGPRPAG